MYLFVFTVEKKGRYFTEASEHAENRTFDIHQLLV